MVLLKKSVSFHSSCCETEGANGNTVMSPGTAQEPSGSWDSIHVFEAYERGRTAHYKVTSTVLLQLVTRKASESDETEKKGSPDAAKKGPDAWKRDGEVILSGSMTRQVRICLGSENLDLNLLCRRRKTSLFRMPRLTLQTPEG